MTNIGRIEDPVKATMVATVIRKHGNYLFTITLITDMPERYYELLRLKYIRINYFSDITFKIWASTKFTKEEFVIELERLYNRGFIKNTDGLKSIAHFLI